ncbi:hypothetical protein [Salinisphaera orenii]|uniref:Uncharacterized protein n=1 Tax=Salinisphaera orenii YIM 95161 TaxID=1051139 RepID=A0A423PHX3_9GAMM|nr:hypothetical protein [Salinisphaera halophila]ROO25133.1 hypothetical protein SAHL_15260 [Salinisphaera halophila YIM 95161]
MIDYLNGVAETHHVNPLLFVFIYLVTTVPFLLISGWLFHHIRRQKPLALLVFLWALCYTAPYLYVLAVGRDLPPWVYVMVALLICGGLGLAGRGLKQRLDAARRND